jgi:hypothetical protein
LVLASADVSAKRSVPDVTSTRSRFAIVPRRSVAGAVKSTVSNGLSSAL